MNGLVDWGELRDEKNKGEKNIKKIEKLNKQIKKKKMICLKKEKEYKAG